MQAKFINRRFCHKVSRSIHVILSCHFAFGSEHNNSIHIKPDMKISKEKFFISKYYSLNRPKINKQVRENALQSNHSCITVSLFTQTGA